MSYSFRSIIDGGADSDLIYYNASIINTQSRDANQIVPATVKFNETRDAPIVRDASQYEYSIIRFSMNGPNKNLPLFIPIIQTNGSAFLQQTNPNLTAYYVSIPYQRAWTFTNSVGAAETRIFTIAITSTPVEYQPEVQNTSLAPVPNVPATGIEKQDISTLYYYVYTYKHWCDLVNKAFLQAMNDTFTAFQTQWNNDPTIASAFPYANFDAFLLDHDVPFIKYDEESKLFEIYADTRAFNVASNLTGNIAPPLTGIPGGCNTPLPAFVPPAPYIVGQPAQVASPAYLRLFFNANLWGLFSSFKHSFLNANRGSSILFPLTGTTLIPLPTPIAPTPIVYTYEILFANQNYTNVLNNNPTLQGFNAVPPPAYNIYFLIPTQKQRTYWISKQDYNTTNSLWSPCASIVFTSTLLPVKKEYTGKPLVLGENNTTATTNSPAAFEPIITDFVIDQQSEKAEGYRDFVLYEPTAEYKMVSLNASHDEIRNIDIQAFWKYRLTGELIPLTMFNCTDVNFKMMFRKKSL